MGGYIHTWAKVLHIVKEATFLGNLCENCSNYLYQHITRVFYCISAKVLLLRYIAHWEIDDNPWQCGNDQKVSLPVAFGRNLELDTTRLFFHMYCQYATKKAPNHQQWCNVANYWTGLKQMDIANHFGVGQSGVSRILSEHHPTGSAKDRPR